jgi:hypothetical protein
MRKAPPKPAPVVPAAPQPYTVEAIRAAKRTEEKVLTSETAKEEVKPAVVIKDEGTKDETSGVVR